MKLEFFRRAAESKGELNAIRRAGNIPAVLYIRGKAGENIVVNNNAYTSLLRTIPQGRLSTAIFELVEEGGKTHRAILKEIQYNPTTYDVIHLDFEELVDNQEINVKVPIELLGVADCVGVKLGGILRQVIRRLKVRCLPKDIPSHFSIDIRSLEINQSKRLSDLKISNALRPLADLKEVAVVVEKR